jgi:hypothetical protein
MRRMFERGNIKTLVIIYSAIADELNLRHMQDRFEIWM